MGRIKGRNQTSLSISIQDLERLKGVCPMRSAAANLRMLLDLLSDKEGNLHQMVLNKLSDRITGKREVSGPKITINPDTGRQEYHMPWGIYKNEPAPEEPEQPSQPDNSPEQPQPSEPMKWMPS